MQALSALTPPLLVCAVVIIAIVAFLRHEMRRSRTDRSGAAGDGEISAAPSSTDREKKQNTLTDAARAAADDNGQASRRLR
jgi:FtsZ-interacting cell division protein ZipA